MIGTYASAALICLASLLVGRAIFTLAGRREWCWLEPAVGFAAIIAVSGILARVPGHGTTATIGIVLLIVVAAAVVWREREYAAPGALGVGVTTALVIAIEAFQTKGTGWTLKIGKARPPSAAALRCGHGTGEGR